MKKNYWNYAFIGVCAVSTATLYSCVDDAYDLNKDIDKTITVGGDLTIPSSSTEEMLLKDILDLEDNSTVVADKNGDYAIVKAGNPSSNDVNVSSVVINGENIKFDSHKMDIDFTGNTGVKKFQVNDYNISINIKENGIDNDIIDIKSALIKENSRATLRLSIVGGNNVGFGVEGGFCIEFPEYMKVKSELCRADGNKLYLNGNYNFVNGVLEIPFNIEKIVFENGSDAVFDRESHAIVMGGNIKINGTIFSINSNVQGNYVFSTGVYCDMIDIDSATAMVNPDINISVKPVEINNLPDFLTEEGVIFEATDPRVFLIVGNNSPLKTNVSMGIVSWKNGLKCNKVRVDSFVIPGNIKDYTICINKFKEGMTDGIFYVKCENLSDVIKNIPDLIEVVDVNAQIVQGEFYDVKLGNTYTINNMYEINTPLMFTGETNIKYTDNFDGMSKDLEDIEFDNLSISMKATNKIPMNLTLTAKAIDTDGYVMENVSITVDKTIPAGNGENASVEDINMLVKTTDGSRVKNLDGLKFMVQGTPTEATSKVAMNENQSLKLDNMKLKVTGGITMDLN